MRKTVPVLFVIFLVFSFVYGCTSATPFPVSSPTPSTSSTPTRIPPSPTPTTPPTKTPIPRILLPVRGLYVAFDRRGEWIGYYTGYVITHFTEMDNTVGHTISEEVALQLDAIQQMGVNTITIELQSSDSTYSDPHVAPTPPTCNTSPELGLKYPQPTPSEIKNLVSFLDMVQSRGMKVYLRLVNTHMEEQPPTNNELWLGTILNAIREHPALDLVLFEGGAHLTDLNGDGIMDSCGGNAEPPLWEGATSVAARYVKWAIQYGHSIGLPYRKLSAEAIVGDYFTYALAPSGPGPTDPHPYDPIHNLKGIFDSLNIPDDQRTYAISFYEHRKCFTAQGLFCVDENPHAWAIETISNLFATIGRQNGARVVAVEMGLLNPLDKTWSEENALESLVWIMQAYGIEGGCFWHWTDQTNFEEKDPRVAQAIKQRGLALTYNPIKDVLTKLYTQGQTNDLTFTPDGITPVFFSIVVSPSGVKSGEPFEITANLGETHLFVTADVSKLNPSQTDLIPMTQKSDGIYQATVMLDRWNAISNGNKTVRIDAMDFWSNIASTSTVINVKNPPPLLDPVPPDDDFNGKILDSTKWKIGTGGGATVSQDERLILSTDNKQASSVAQATSNWEFPGDFDVQVDFQIGEGWDSPAEDHLDGAYLAVTIDGQDYRITKVRNSNEDKFFSWSTTGVLSKSWESESVSGKYRLVRIGTDLFLLFDIGEGWQELASTTVPSSAAQLNLGNASLNASTAFTTYYDNFLINSGFTTYKP
jgi:hypothetical protein